MRVKLKGVAKVRKKLADGTVATYYYAWRGDPSLEGALGSPEFQMSYVAAHESRRLKPKDILRTVLDAFQDSSDFTSLAQRTRSDYRKHIKLIDAEFGDFPIPALTDRRTRGEFLTWRDRIGAQSRRTAEYRFAILARILAWALDRGLVAANPCQRPGRLYRSQRSESVWTDGDEAAFYAKAPEHLHLALILALWTAQRQGDLVRLTWAAYDGAQIRLTQGKTQSRVSGRRAKRIVIPVGKPLKLALDSMKKFHEEAGRPLPATILVTESGTS
jgi:integrase